MASLAEMERELIVERTRAGLEVARQLGRTGGRKRQMTEIKVRAAKKLLASGVPARDGRYTFTGTANQNVDAVLSNSTFSGCYSVVVSIINPNGSQLVSNAVCGSSNNDLGSVALPTAGTYTVVVTPLNAGTGKGVANIFSQDRLPPLQSSRLQLELSG